MIKKVSIVLWLALLQVGAASAFADDDATETRCSIELEYKGLLGISTEGEDTLQEALSEVREEACEDVCKALRENGACEKDCIKDAKIIGSECKQKRVVVHSEGKLSDRKLIRETIKKQRAEAKELHKPSKTEDEDKIRCRMEIDYRGQIVVLKEDGDEQEEMIQELREDACKRACKLAGGTVGCKKSCLTDASIVATECKIKAKVTLSEGEFSSKEELAKKRKVQKQEKKKALVSAKGQTAGESTCIMQIRYNKQTQRATKRSNSVDKAMSDARMDACDKVCDKTKNEDACTKDCIAKAEAINISCW